MIGANPDRVATWGDRELERHVRACADRLDPAGATARARTAEADRRVTLRPIPDTMALLTAVLPVAQAVAVHAALARAAATAKAAGDPRTKNQIMADTLVALVTGQATASDIPIEVQVIITDRALLDGEDTPAHIPGYGPVPAAWARHLLTPDPDDPELDDPNLQPERGEPDDADTLPDDADTEPHECDAYLDVLDDEQTDAEALDIERDGLHPGRDTDRHEPDDLDDPDIEAHDEPAPVDEDRTAVTGHHWPHPGASDATEPGPDHEPARHRPPPAGSGPPAHPETRPTPPGPPAPFTPSVPPPRATRRAATWLRRLFTHPATGTLVAMDSRRRTFDAGLRRFLITRDGTCRTPWCDAPIRHLDHIHRWADGGATTATNGEGLCVRCNLTHEQPGFHTRVLHPGPTANDPPHPDSDPADRQHDTTDAGTPHTVQLTTPTGHTYTCTAPPVLPEQTDARTPDTSAGPDTAPDDDTHRARIIQLACPGLRILTIPYDQLRAS